MPTEKEMAEVVGILKKNRHRFITPALTEISNQTKNEFQVLISCILSLRTRDETTAKASARLFAIAKTPEDMAKLRPKTIEKAIYPVGFYKTKAVRIKQICKELVENHKSKVPDTIEVLLKFKGVGRKTANIVMVYGFHKPGIPVDTHVHRISNRLGWVKTKMPDKTEVELRKILPKKYWMDFNDLFVQFGQNICRPIGPKCGECPITKHCKYYRSL